MRALISNQRCECRFVSLRVQRNELENSPTVDGIQHAFRGSASFIWTCSACGRINRVDRPKSTMSSNYVNISQQTGAVVPLVLTKLIGRRTTASNAGFPKRILFAPTASAQIHRLSLNRAFCGNIPWQSYTESFTRASERCNLLSVVSPFCIKPDFRKCARRGTNVPPEDELQNPSGHDVKKERCSLVDENFNSCVDTNGFQDQDKRPMHSTPKPHRTGVATPRSDNRVEFSPGNPPCARGSRKKSRKPKLAQKGQHSVSKEQLDAKREESKMESMLRSLIKERKFRPASGSSLESTCFQRLEACLAQLVGYVIKNPERTSRLAAIICELHAQNLIDDDMMARVFRAHLRRAEKTLKEVPVYHDYVISIVSQLLEGAKSVTQIKIDDERTSF